MSPQQSRKAHRGGVALLAATLAVCSAVQAAPKKPAARADVEVDALAYGRRDDVLAFAQEVAAAHQLPVDKLEAALAQARFQPKVARLIMPPPAGTAKNWAAYRARFLDPPRQRAGLAFWQQHEPWLTAAEARYGVPAAVVVSVIGVETFYGRVMGEFRVIDALATLAFDFPKGRKDRSAFFRSELAHLLVLALREGRDPLSFKGSYAGAMGLPQFMPGSHLKWAVDMDQDGQINLIASPADAIGSVAHYLASHGWQRGMPTHYAVAAPTDTTDRATLLGPDILPSFSAAQLLERGAVLDDAGRRHEGLLALVELQNGDAAPTHVAGTANFYAITRYNWSSYYAMAVIDLAQALQQGRQNAGASR